MKQVLSKQNVYSTNPTSQFKMSVNEKSFAILTSGIYQNKIAAIIREYSTNALDAQIQSGFTGPFDVHLPTYDDCYFYVKDYGIGLSEEDFENVFFTFFESTKDNSNALNGMLGLGSKSFASYNTKSCTVESIKDGKKYIYNCFIGSTGMPEYVKLLESETQEANGVKVKIPVKREDIHEFEKNAIEIYKWFSIKPKFVGKSVNLNNELINYKSFSLQKNRPYYNTESLAIMGNVAYKIDNNYKLDKYKDIINSDVVLFFDNGDLCFTPSRETLEYNDKTISCLSKKLENVKQELNTIIQEAVDKCKNEYEAILTFQAEKEKLNHVKITLVNDIIYKNKLLKDRIVLKDDEEVKLLYRGRSKSYLTQDILLNQKYQFIVNDVKIGVVSIAKLYVETYSKNVYIVDQNFVDNFPYTHDSSIFLKASELPKPTVSRSYTRGKLNWISILQGGYSSTNSWKNLEEDFDTDDLDDQYYIIRKGYKAVINNQEFIAHDVDQFFKKIGYIDNVYGINEKNIKKAENLGLKNVEILLQKLIEKFKKEFNSIRPTLIEYVKIRNMFYSNQNFIENIKKLKTKFKLPDELISVYSECEKLKSVEEKNDAILLKLELINKFYPNSIDNLTNTDYDKTIFSKYEHLTSRICLDYSLYYYYIIGVNHANGNV